MVSKNTLLLKWYNFFYDFRPYEAIAILYYAQVTGSFTQALAIFSVASVAAAIAEVPTGILSDRVGRRMTVILGSVSSVIAITLYALGGSFAMLAAGAVFNGITRAFLSGNNDALLYDTLKQEGKSDTFSEKLGKVNSMFEVGLAVSALLGGIIAIWSLQMVMVASILPQVICALLALRFVEPQRHSQEIQENIYSHLKEAVVAFKYNAKLRKVSIAYIIDYAVDETHYQFKPAFNALVWPDWALGIARSMDNIFGFLGYHFAGRVIERFGALKTLLAQQIIGKLNIVAATTIPFVFSPVILSINAFFFGVGSTANQGILQREFTDKQRATMGSLNSLAGSLLYALCNIAAGAFADNYGPAKTLLALGIVSLPVIWIYRRLAKSKA